MSRAAADRRVLDDATGFRAMTWVMAIMVFLTVLAAAMGLGLSGASRTLRHQVAGRLTVQVVEGDPARREATARVALARLRAMSGVSRAVAVPPQQLAALVRPWLGTAGDDPDLPLPALIDVTLANEAAAPAVMHDLRRLDPSVRVDGEQRWMAPVSSFLSSLQWLAAGLVVLMLTATGAVAGLAARSGLETHRATIEVMHMLGSTDVQIARLFQRRVALDAVIGGAAGTLLAVAVVMIIGTRLSRLGSELLDGVMLGAGDWVALALVPILFVLLAMAAARVTVVSALRRMV